MIPAYRPEVDASTVSIESTGASANLRERKLLVVCVLTSKAPGWSVKEEALMVKISGLEKDQSRGIYGGIFWTDPLLVLATRDKFLSSWLFRPTVALIGRFVVIR